MKKVIAILCSLLVISLFAVEELPKLRLSVEDTITASADEAYVLFLLECSAVNITEAQNAFNRKYEEASGKIKAAFPKAKENIVSVNIGIRDSDRSRSSEPMIPTITKALYYTLPADEEQAVKLLDIGIEAGLTPFCGSLKGTSGAIFYGLRNSEPVREKLRLNLVQKLWGEAERISGIAEEKTLGELIYISTYQGRGRKPCEVNFRNTSVTLPAEFCDGDKNRIQVFLALHAAFEWCDK